MMALNPFYQRCALEGKHGHVCRGRVTWEHALIFAGRKIQKPWSIIPLCAKAHEVDYFQDAHTMSKEMNVWVALNMATPEELKEVSKAIDYVRERDRLNSIYGTYQKPEAPVDSGLVINYGF